MTEQQKTQEATMAALTEDRNTPYMNGESFGAPVAAGIKIFAGALLVADSTGYVAPGSESATVTYLGRAEEAVDNTSGANGSKTVMIRRGAAFLWSNHSSDPVTQACLGKLCYIADDQTVAKTATGRSQAGIVLGIEGDGVWVL